MRYFACTVVVQAKDNEDARRKLDHVLWAPVGSPSRPVIVAEGLDPCTRYKVGYLEVSADPLLAVPTSDFNETYNTGRSEGGPGSVAIPLLGITLNPESKCSDVRAYIKECKDGSEWKPVARFRPEVASGLYVNSVQAI